MAFTGSSVTNSFENQLFLAVHDFTTDVIKISWTVASFTCRGALVYNSSKSNKSIFVLDFGTNKTVTAGTLTIQFPTADVNNAIAVISSVTN